MSVSSKPWWQERLTVPNGKPLTNGAAKKWWQAMGEPCSNVLLVKLTKELAEQLWDRNEHNRRFREHLAAKYAVEMEEGRWLCNGETIVFDTHGRLIQGQHRVKGVIISGVTIYTYMVFDVDPAAFITMDSGAKRSAADQLGIVGQKHTTALASAATLLYRYDTGGLTHSTQIPNTLCLDYIDKCPSLADSVDLICTSGCRKAKPSVMAAAHYLTSKISPKESESFWDKFITGVDMKEGDPELVLIRKLESLNAGGSKKILKSYVELYCFAVAWNARRDRKRISMIRLPNYFDSSTCPEFR